MTHRCRSGLQFLVAITSIALLSNCSFFNSRLPLMGTVSDGTYTHYREFFSCPLTASGLGLNGSPDIVDARRIVETEEIPQHQREPSDWKRTRIVRDEVVPGQVKFQDASGTSVEFINSRRQRPMDAELNAFSTGGFTWVFNHHEIQHPNGRMKIMLQLVPWYNEGEGYMGSNLRRAFAMEDNPLLELWVVSNLVTSDNYHNVIVRIPARPLLKPETNSRDILAVRDDIIANPQLQTQLLKDAENWLSVCRFAEVFK